MAAAAHVSHRQCLRVFGEVEVCANCFTLHPPERTSVRNSTPLLINSEICRTPKTSSPLWRPKNSQHLSISEGKCLFAPWCLATCVRQFSQNFALDKGGVVTHPPSARPLPPSRVWLGSFVAFSPPPLSTFPTTTHPGCARTVFTFS